MLQPALKHSTQERYDKSLWIQNPLFKLKDFLSKAKFRKPNRTQNISLETH